MSKVDKILQIIDDRIFDANQNVNSLPIDHPMEAEKLAYLKSLEDLKRDLKREGLAQ